MTTPNQANYNLAELNRRFAQVVLVGTIEAVDYTRMPPSAKVRLGDGTDGQPLVTDYLPLPADIGNNYHRWRPVRVGTQVAIACPGGDPKRGVILALYPSATVAPPATRSDLDVIVFTDGTTLTKSAQELRVVTPCDLVFEPRKTTFKGDLTVHNGDVVVTSGDVKAGDISLKTHRHGGVRAGTDSSGAASA